MDDMAEFCRVGNGVGAGIGDIRVLAKGEITSVPLSFPFSLPFSFPFSLPFSAPLPLRLTEELLDCFLVGVLGRLWVFSHAFHVQL